MKYLVVMGAAVTADGRPSGALKRRLDAALASKEAHDSRMFLVTGGTGRAGPAEAHVMTEYLLGKGVADGAVIAESASTDTLQSVVNCAAILRNRYDSAGVVIYSDHYHLPRCCLLFRLLGIPATGGIVPSGRDAMGLRKWLYMWLREGLALPFDALLILLGRGNRAP
jgi:vancomycin permeability regulator SanA